MIAVGFDNVLFPALRCPTFLAALGILLFGALAPARAADSYVLPHGETVAVDEHSQCRVITNNHASGQSIWIPTTTPQEWTSFRDHLPAGVTAVACDRTPNAFSFNDVTNAALNTLTTPSPATVTIAGINAPTPVSVSGQGAPRISINGGAWVTSGMVENGQTLAVRLTSAAANSTVYSATVTVGGVTDNWSVTTVSGDTTPDAFSFNDVTGATTSTLTTPSPASVTISGINAAATVSVSGQGSPQIKVASGSWTTSTTITNGQALYVRLTSAAANGTTYTATINVGGVTDSWTVTTSAGSASCTLDGVTVVHGASRYFYSNSSPTCNDTCTTVRQNRTCNNGTLSGSATYNKANCSQGTCQCYVNYSGTYNIGSAYSFPATTVCNGKTINFYRVQFKRDNGQGCYYYCTGCACSCTVYVGHASALLTSRTGTVPDNSGTFTDTTTACQSSSSISVKYSPAGWPAGASVQYRE